MFSLCSGAVVLDRQDSRCLPVHDLEPKQICYVVLFQRAEVNLTEEQEGPDSELK